MGDKKLNSFASQVQLLMETQPGFPQGFHKRLLLESNKMTNHFEFIGKLLSKGLLYDGTNDSEVTMGLKEMMVQLAVMMAISKGDEAICGLLEALDESGNSELISALQAMMITKEDFGIETEGGLSEAKGNDLIVQNPKSHMLAKQVTIQNELSSIGTKLIDKIMLRVDEEFMEQLEGHFVGKASRIFNHPEFCSHLANDKVLEEAHLQLTTGSKAHEGRWTEKAIKAACSKQAIGSLVLALQRSGNECILQETIEWLETGPARKKNYPIPVKSLEEEQRKKQENAPKSHFLDLPAPASGPQNVAAFNFQLRSSSPEGIFALEFDSDRMIAHSTLGTFSILNRQDNEEKEIEFGAKLKDITWFQCDEEIAVLGTAAGTVHLLDLKTLEEKSTVPLHGPVKSLKFVESSLVVITALPKSDLSWEEIWWIDISRVEMQLRIRSSMGNLNWSNTNSILFMDSDYCFLDIGDGVYIHYTKTGEQVFNESCASYLYAPAAIRTFNAVDLVSTKANFIARGQNGEIVMWGSCKFQFDQKPLKCFKANKAAVVSLCGVSGHLLSLDQSGELVMWPGQDLEDENKTSVVTRLLAKNFCTGNVTSLFGYDRWFASSSSKEGFVNIWTLPELWLRTG